MKEGKKRSEQKAEREAHFISYETSRMTLAVIFHVQEHVTKYQKDGSSVQYVSGCIEMYLNVHTMRINDWKWVRKTSLYVYVLVLYISHILQIVTNHL